MLRDSIASMLETWRNSLPNADLHYAVKANSDPLVLKTVLDLGFSLDVASAYEMELAIRLGADGSRLLLSHPTKTEATIHGIRKYHPKAIVIDSIRELLRLGEIGLPEAEYQPVVFVRFATESNGVQDDLNVKFGCDETGATELLVRAKQSGFGRLGLAFHVGTQCVDMNNFRVAVRKAKRIAAAAEACGVSVNWLDIGGGFCDRSRAERHGTTPRLLFEEVNRILGEEAKGFEVIAEPGRVVVADSGWLVTKVISQERRRNGQWRVIVDDHLYGGLCGQVFDSREFSFSAFRTREDSPLDTALERATIFGATCDSIDRVDSPNGNTHLLPGNLDFGDYLAVGNMGAYTSTSGSSFNGIDPAGIVLVWQEGPEVSYIKSPHFYRSKSLLEATYPLRDAKTNVNIVRLAHAT
jgi:ornithine decarboxylase